jgi:ribose 5-phosphate isomerase
MEAKDEEANGMRNLITGILIGMLIGIGAGATDDLLLEHASSYEPPKSERGG